MSIIGTTDEGWFLDHQKNIEISYPYVQDKAECAQYFKCSCPNSMFNIKCPYMMDSQYAAKYSIGAGSTTISSPTTSLSTKDRRIRKKKRKLPQNQEDIDSMEFHEKILAILEKALEQLLSLAVEKGALEVKENGWVMPEDNNKDAKAFAKMEGPGNALVNLCSSTSHEEKAVLDPVYLPKHGTEISFNVANRLIKYTDKEPCIKSIQGNQYLIPPDSSFLLSDLAHLEPLLMHAKLHKKYDIIVLDPPWQNKSIKRKKEYYTLQDQDMLNIPMNDLMSDNCLVVMWITNKPRLHRFVLDELLPEWKLYFQTYWYWLKVTKYGEPILSLDVNETKRPYECLVIASKNVELLVPKNQVIVSVPCATHSRKPPLHDILRTIVQASNKNIEDLQCLEMFARNLQPGWTSWGNEVIKHQHTSFFVKENVNQPALT